ncbi:MAG: hypothetical protein OWQ54_09180 [Sulfolobaceae archaeon]|nr:hypothetical protein [Sulfolobaceae archaeon]
MCDPELARELYEKCKSENCKKVVEFVTDNLCREERDTLAVIDRYPRETWTGFQKMIRNYLKKSLKIYDDLIFKEDIVKTVYNGYYNALKGNLHSAEESNRFLIERVCLSIYVQHTTPLYLEILDKRIWHKMVDRGYIVRNAGEALSRVRKISKDDDIEGDRIFLIGKPVCRKHLEFPRYSMPLRAFKVKEKLKCHCGSNAEYLTLVMPKVNALIGLSCHIMNYKPRRLERIYSNLSRVVHPYGFVSVPKAQSLTIWFRDYFLLSSEFAKVLNVKV